MLYSLLSLWNIVVIQINYPFTDVISQKDNYFMSGIGKTIYFNCFCIGELHHKFFFYPQNKFNQLCQIRTHLSLERWNCLFSLSAKKNPTSHVSVCMFLASINVPTLAFCRNSPALGNNVGDSVFLPLPFIDVCPGYTGTVPRSPADSYLKASLTTWN